MSDRPKPNDGMFTHAPLPYVVILRGALADDSAPTRVERRVVAYSVFEALMQALFEAGGLSADITKWTVERVEPDLPAYTMSLLTTLLGEVR